MYLPWREREREEKKVKNLGGQLCEGRDVRTTSWMRIVYLFGSHVRPSYRKSASIDFYFHRLI
jgi:hypothetical protein